MKIGYHKINPQYEIDKQEINQSTKVTDKIEDTKNQTILSPLVPVQLSKRLIHSNDLLATCIETLAQDIILNDIKLLTINGEEVDQTVQDFWNIKNIYELYLAVQDRIGYGYGALELIYNKEGQLKELKQVSAETLDIQVENNTDGTKSHYARYINGTDRFNMKLSRHTYDNEDDELHTLLWLGGGKESEYYDMPVWFESFNKISAQMLLDELNAKKINEGNLISGILTVISPPMTSREIDKETGEIIEHTGGEQINNKLQEQITSAGTGWMVLHLEQLTAELPLNVQYIPITEQNYDYLRQLAEDCDNSILRRFKIPKARLMIDDTKESMNSNKTSTLWEIYTKELESLQIVYENIIDDFNCKYFQITTYTNIGTPIFTDKKQIEVASTIQLFDMGLLTLGEAITNIKKYYPELELEVNPNNPLYNERYYKGQVLGMANYDAEVGNNTDMEELYAFFDESTQ